MTIDELLAGESQHVEYKRERSANAKSYLKTVVAFANARGGALVFGVEDATHEVIGLSDETLFEDMDAIANAIADSIRPSIYPDIYVQNVDGKNLIVVEVAYGKTRPYYLASEGLEHGVYVRVGATSRPADLQWAHMLMVESAPEGYDRLPRNGYTVTDEAIEALCEKMYQVALSRCHSDDERADLRRPTQSQLLRWGVLCERDGEIRPTVAFSLLSGDGEVLSRVQCAVFRGTDRAIFADRKEYEGSVIDVLEQANRFVLEKMNVGADLSALVRRDVYEFPLWAVRELITNAVLHKLYLEAAAVQVALYDDRLEITSPGGILRGLTLEKILSGTSKARNEALAEAFRYMRLVEGWGSGLRRVIREVTEYGLPEPEFLDMGDTFRVNVYRVLDTSKGYDTEYTKVLRHPLADSGFSANDDGRLDNKSDNNDNPDNKSDNNDNPDNKSDNNDLIMAKLFESKSSSLEQRRRMLEIIRENPGVTQAELVEELGVARSTLTGWIAQLQEKGYLVREGSRKRGRWIVVGSGDMNGQ